MVISNRHISRRTMLRGIGATLALAYELHGAGGVGVMVRTLGAGGWNNAVALHSLGNSLRGTPEAAYDVTLAAGPGGMLWAAWIEAREAAYGVWVARAPLGTAGDAAAWSAPQRVSTFPLCWSMVAFPSGPFSATSGSVPSCDVC